MHLKRAMKTIPLVTLVMLVPEVAYAQTASSTSSTAAEPAAANIERFIVDSNSDRFRVHIPSAHDAHPQRNVPGPWVSMVSNPPLMFGGPLLQVQGMQSAPRAPLTPLDRELESRFVARRTVGGILIGLSSPFLITGVWLLSVAASVDASNEGLAGAFIVGAAAGFLGITSTAIGVGLFIPGLVYAVSDPPRPDSAAMRLRPTLHVGPRGASLSMSF